MFLGSLDAGSWRFVSWGSNVGKEDLKFLYSDHRPHFRLCPFKLSSAYITTSVSLRTEKHRLVIATYISSGWEWNSDFNECKV